MTFNELLFHIPILADTGVGKHTLIRKYLKSPFRSDHMKTLGIEIRKVDMELNEIRISLRLAFLGKSEIFRSLYPPYCQGSNGAIIMYDITNPRTLDKIPEWIHMIREVAEDIPILLVGNKADLKNRKISKKEAIKIKKTHNLSSFMEISLKSGKKVLKMFRKITVFTFLNMNLNII